MRLPSITFALRSRRAVVDGAVLEATVCIRDGVVESIKGGGAAVTDRPVTDLGDVALLPGLVDSHVHVNEPGRTAWEGFFTATAAAAAGGVTTLVDMPLNCTPVTTSVAALETKLEACRPSLHVDVGFWGGVVPGNAAELGPLVARGALGAKAFLCHSGIDDFPASGPDDLRAAMRALRAAGAPLLVHAELCEVAAPPPPPDSSPRSYLRYLRSRPAAWEVAAVELMVELVAETGCAVHIVHLSAADALPALRAARAAGLPVTVETCPHYLCLRAEEVPDGATPYKCAPPIRGEANREALWAALLAGDIDAVVSDHSPCTPELKRLDLGDFEAAWGGVASLQLGLPVVWREARARGADLAVLARWMAEAPARLAGLGDRKGVIAPGRAADLVAFDPEEEPIIQKESLRFRHKTSPYVGRPVAGAVRGVWLAGRPIFDGVEVAAPTGAPLLGRAPGASPPASTSEER